jgi:hypothetical protein
MRGYHGSSLEIIEEFAPRDVLFCLRKDGKQRTGTATLNKK